MTAADHAAEGHPARPPSPDPNIPVISEEEHAAGKSPAGDHDTFWLVDPLDGTRSFVDSHWGIHRQYRVGEQRHADLGVMYPGRWRLLRRRRSRTAVHCVQGRADVHISARTMPADGLTVLSSRSHGDRAKLDAFLQGKLVRSTAIPAAP